jgi:hypothetical protein
VLTTSNVGEPIVNDRAMVLGAIVLLAKTEGELISNDLLITLGTTVAGNVGVLIANEREIVDGEVVADTAISLNVKPSNVASYDVTSPYNRNPPLVPVVIELSVTLKCDDPDPAKYILIVVPFAWTLINSAASVWVPVVRLVNVPVTNLYNAVAAELAIISAIYAVSAPDW